MLLLRVKVLASISLKVRRENAKLLKPILQNVQLYSHSGVDGLSHQLHDPLSQSGLKLSTDWGNCHPACLRFWRTRRTLRETVGIRGQCPSWVPGPQIVHVPGDVPGIAPLAHGCAILKSVVQPVASCVAHKPDSPVDGNAKGMIWRPHPKILGPPTFHLFVWETHFKRCLPFSMRMAIGEGTLRGQHTEAWSIIVRAASCKSQSLFSAMPFWKCSFTLQYAIVCPCRLMSSTKRFSANHPLSAWYCLTFMPNGSQYLSKASFARRVLLAVSDSWRWTYPCRL